MILSIGYNENVADIVINNDNKGYPLGDTRVVETNISENGTVWFNLRGKKKLSFVLDFKLYKVDATSSDYLMIKERSIPDYLLPVWVKFENANANNNFELQTEYEGMARIVLARDTVGQEQVTRDITLKIYAQ